jgi:hypothetical protein
MTFTPRIWRPIAFGLSALNLVAVGFAARDAEPWHAAAHAGLALGLALWAERLGRRPLDRGPGDDRLDEVETQVADLRQEVAALQERLDFTERILAQPPEPRPVEAAPPR